MSDSQKPKSESADPFTLPDWFAQGTALPRPKAYMDLFGVASRRFTERALLFQFIYSVIGLVLGLICILGGVVLFLNGVAGSTSWTAKILGAESRISDAAPGVILFVVGLFVVLITRFTVRVRKHENDKTAN